MTPNIQSMIKQAIAARDSAYAPYSNHPVGAAILTQDGTVHCGANVENAAYPLTACAETTAIGNMVLGHRQAASQRPLIDTVVVVGPGYDICTPCGGCRQKIREFAGPDTRIIVCDRDGKIVLECAFFDLLPHSFGPDNIAKVAHSA